MFVFKFQIDLVRIQPESLNGSETKRGVGKVKTEERLSTKEGEVLTVNSVLPSSGQPQRCCCLFFFLSHKGPPELQLEVSVKDPVLLKDFFFF